MEAKDSGNDISNLITCPMCERAMLHPVVAECGHAIGCQTCVEEYFEKHIPINSKKRKATRIDCTHCGTPFAKPSRGKKLCIDHTLGLVCKYMRPTDFNEGNRHMTPKDSFLSTVTELKKAILSCPIEGIVNQHYYREKVYTFLDQQAKRVSDIRKCKCSVSNWEEGIVMYPKKSGKGKWFMGCPRWNPGQGKDDNGCSFFEWVGVSDARRFGLD